LLRLAGQVTLNIVGQIGYPLMVLHLEEGWNVAHWGMAMGKMVNWFGLVRPCDLFGT